MPSIRQATKNLRNALDHAYHLNRSRDERRPWFLILKKNFLMIWSCGPGLCIGSFIARLARAIISVAVLYVAKLIVDNVAVGSSSNNSQILVLALLEFFLAIALEILRRISDYAENLLGYEFALTAQSQVLVACARLDLEQIDTKEMQDKIDCALSRSQDAKSYLSQVFTQFQGSVTLISLLTLIFQFSVIIPILLLSAAIIPFLSDLLVSAAEYNLFVGNASSRRSAQIAKETVTRPAAAKQVKAMGAAKYILRIFDESSKRILDKSKSFEKTKLIIGIVGSCISTVSLYISYLIVIYATASAKITLGNMTLLVASLYQLRGLFDGLLHGLSHLAEEMLYFGDLISVLSMKPQIVGSSFDLPAEHCGENIIRFEEVCFRYPGSSTNILSSANLMFKTGECIAIVGQNGTGKTTILQLLARLYDSTSGVIKYNGVNIKDLDPETYRNQISVLFQNPIQVDADIASNMNLADAKNVNSPEADKQTNDVLGLEKVLGRFPFGREELIGSMIGGVRELSGGEWRVIAIARALRSCAPILALDEPTTSLDGQKKDLLFRELQERKKKQAIIVATHDPELLKLSDRIYLLDGGAFIACGKHRELLLTCDSYAQLFA